MELREIRYFVAVAEELHFRRAAERVGINQSALSKAIILLESELGVQLFVRTRRSTRLTPVGEMLLADARRILAEVDNARRTLLAAASGRKGRLRIAVGDGLAHPCIVKLIVQMREECPEVDIQIVHQPLPVQLNALRLGTLDVGFALSGVQDEELCSVLLWKDALVAVLRADHPLASQSSVSPIEAEATPLMVLGERLPVPVSMMERLFYGTKQIEMAIEYVSSGELLLTLVAAGFGIGILSAAQAQIICRTELLVRPLSTPNVTADTYLVSRRDDDSKLVRLFIERAQRMA